MKILFTGGGTLGPVTPLIAIHDAWKEADPEAQFAWVGTPNGPERELIEPLGIPFHALSAPKVHRHAPLRWAFIPLKMMLAMRNALVIIQKERPDAIVSAGGFVDVPVVWVAKLYGVPTWIHQQDVRPGLANKVMAPVATGISCAWERSAHAFPAKKTEVVGNPVRESVKHGSKEQAAQTFTLDTARPTVLVIGGGTGSEWLNRSMAQIAPDLVNRTNILHLTGKGKPGLEEDPPRWYTAIELVKNMADAYAVADLVVCRAGMGTISELAALRKPAIIVPIPNSQQEDNTSVLEEHDAAVVLHQERTTPQILQEKIEELLGSPPQRIGLGSRLNGLLPTQRVAEILMNRIKTITTSTV